VALCFTIFVEAIERLAMREPLENADLLLYVGGAGLLINLIGLCLFHNHGKLIILYLPHHQTQLWCQTQRLTKSIKANTALVKRYMEVLCVVLFERIWPTALFGLTIQGSKFNFRNYNINRNYEASLRYQHNLVWPFYIWLCTQFFCYESQ